jgi:hypothetical protein
MNAFSQKLNISEMDLPEFVDACKAGKAADMKATYLWTGSIVSIIRQNDNTEITVIKSIWADKNTLNNYKAILVTKDPNLILKAEKIGLNKKIIFIIQISEIKDSNPVCIPLLIREI